MASKMKVTFPKSQRTDKKCHGRLDFLVQGRDGEEGIETGDIGKLAMGELGATSVQSSSYQKKDSNQGAASVKLYSKSCFHNDNWEFEKDFWIVVDFPKTDFYEVEQLIL